MANDEQRGTMYGSGEQMRHGERGFTLVELMIAMVVTALIILVILVTFTAQNQLYRRQHDIGKMQQSLRLAMEVVTKDIAMAGFGAGVAGEFYGVMPEAAPDSELQAVRDGDQIPAGSYSDAIWLVYVDPDRNHWGYVDQSEAGSGVAGDYQCETGTLRFSSATVAAAANFDQSNDAWDQIACFAHAGNSGLGVTYVWDVLGEGDSSTGIVNVTPGNSTDFTAMCERGLPEEMVCSAIVTVAYYVDRDGDGNGPGDADIPYLMMSTDDELNEGDDIPIAPGIEDLQFGYCEQLEDCDSLAWTGKHELPLPYNFANLSRIRVRMTARSERQEEQGLPAGAPVVLDENYSISTTPDTYHRRVAHQVVVLRNARSALQIRDKY